MSSFYQVYRLITVPSKTNTHTVGREEAWYFRLDKEFASLDDAKNYVIYQNIMYSELPSLLVNLNSEERDRAIQNFCFSVVPNHSQRFFLGLPDSKIFIKSLKDAGITVV